MHTTILDIYVELHYRHKNHKDLQRLAEHNPDSAILFEDSLVECHCPSRPGRIDWTHRVKQDEKDYKRLGKPCLPNHKVLNHEKEQQRG